MMDGEDEREGLVSSVSSIGPQLSEVVEQEGSSYQAAVVHGEQSGAIVSRDKPAFLREQLNDVCQNVNSFIGNVGEPSSKASDSPLQGGFELNNVGVSDNSVRDIQNQCNNHISFDRNSIQDRTQCLSNSVGNVSNFSNSITQRYTSCVSTLDQTTTPMHSVNPNVSGSGGSRDWNTERGETDGTNKINNKRRLPGGVAIGAPAPKIKRKRQNVPEPKQQLRQFPSPGFPQASPTSDPNLALPTSSTSPLPLSSAPSPNSSTYLVTSPTTFPQISTPISTIASSIATDNVQHLPSTSTFSSHTTPTLPTYTPTAPIDLGSYPPTEHPFSNESTPPFESPAICNSSSDQTFVQTREDTSNNFQLNEQILDDKATHQSVLEQVMHVPEYKDEGDNSKLFNYHEGPERIQGKSPVQSDIIPTTSSSPPVNDEDTGRDGNVVKSYSVPVDENVSRNSETKEYVNRDQCDFESTLEEGSKVNESVVGALNINPVNSSTSLESLPLDCYTSPHEAADAETSGSISKPDEKETDSVEGIPGLGTEPNVNNENFESEIPENAHAVNSAKDVVDNVTRPECEEQDSSRFPKDFDNEELSTPNLAQEAEDTESKGLAEGLNTQMPEDNTAESPKMQLDDPLAGISSAMEESVGNEALDSGDALGSQSQIMNTIIKQEPPDETLALSKVRFRDKEDTTEEMPVSKPKVKERDRGTRDGKATSDEDEENSDGEQRKRLLRRKGGASGLSAKPKVKNLRKNIREIISDDKLEENTLAAQKEEQMRLHRMQEKQQALREYMEQQQVERLVAEVAEAAEAVTAAEAVEEVEAAQLAAEDEKEADSDAEAKARSDDSDIVVLSSEEDDDDMKGKRDEMDSESESNDDEPLLKPKKEIKSENEESMSDSEQDEDHKSKASDESESESDSDVVVLSHSEDEEEEDDVNNSGAHVNDQFNLPDAQGRVLVNVGHPESEPDIFLAPQLTSTIKPHQIGGVRFLYENIVESLEQFKTSNGFGCILAHSMGLGKTLQVVSFTDIFLRHTGARTVVIIVPINTLQNWQAEYNQWLPEERPSGVPEDIEIQCRTFKVFILNDMQKNLQARFKVIDQWYKTGGVLLMGYELYRQLSLKKPKKPKKKKKRKNQLDDDIVDIEEEDKNKELLDEMQKALVRPGPDLVICDEGHRIKNAHANISQALKNIRTKRRVVLTGYPLQNNLLEYWCMVDFIRPNYLGTKTEFCNMFERPIQNGQCVDSTPQDVKIMRYRAHVLHSLLEGFVQRRGHSVLAKTLPSKQEHVLLCRMTKIQRTLYSAYMAELQINKAVANPLKAFAVCCKIWNHPDVLYNFVMRRINEDFDLDLDEVVGKVGKTKKQARIEPLKGNELPPPFQQQSMPSWNLGNSSMNRMPPQQPPPPNMNMGSSVQGLGMQNTMGQGSMPPSMMHPNMNHPGMASHNQESNQQHHGMGLGRENVPHPGMGMGSYGMGMYNMHQNYNMHQMPPPYPWGYNQGYPPNPNDPNVQHYPPSAPYGSPYPPPQYQQPHHMQQQQPPQQQQQQPLQQLPMAHHQQPMPPSQGIPGYPPMSMMHNSLGMGPPPAHPSMHQSCHPLNASQPNASVHEPNLQGMHQQSALNLSHQASNQNIHSQNASEMNSMMGQNSPGMHDQGAQAMHNRPNQSTGMSDQQPNQTMQEPNQALPHNLSNQNNPDGMNPQDFTAAMPNASSENYSKMSPENLSQNVNETSFQSSQDSLSSLLNQDMKDLGLEDKTNRDSELMDSKGSLSALLSASDMDTKPPLSAETKPSTDNKDNVSSSEPSKTKSEEESKEEDKTSKSEEGKTEKMEEEDKKEDKKEDVKKDELTFEWAENLFKDYVPGLLDHSTKFQVFFKILEGTLKVGDRLLVFSQSLFTLSLLEEFLQRSFIPGTYEGWVKNRTYFRLDGSTSAQEREKLINEFNTNSQVHLFLVSTRAGSLGINLVGANRVIVFDASFNPCHDTQAVCRVYRYGQQKQCHIYRLVTDNSLERRIYDRQVNKQGIADRIVDEMNPEAHLSSKEISNLLVDNEEDPEPEDMEDDDGVDDHILKEIIKEKSIMFTRLPFKHESLLIDRKDKKLSNAEKRLAKRSYELEKQANISYSRPSYSSFYPKNSNSQTVMMGTKIGGIVYAKPVGTVRPMQAEMGQKIEGGGAMMHRPNILSRSQSNLPVESLAKQGVSVQQITVPKDVSIPTNSGDGKPIHLKSGQSVMVIKTQKGMYLRLSDGKIIAIRTPPEEAFGLPLNQGSVTIVPTMMNNPRPRGGRGGILPTRRGRPPMSAQYALGQVVPKGTSKGQMAVRILRKPVVSSRGGKTYQTIAVPVSSSGQGALLNKSVVITPAKPGVGRGKFLKDLKISPKVQITPVPSKNRSSLSSIAGTSGLTKRLNRNNKIISAQALAMKEEEKKTQDMKTKPAMGKRDSGSEASEDSKDGSKAFDLKSPGDDSSEKEEAKSTSKQTESPNDAASELRQTESAGVTDTRNSSMEVDSTENNIQQQPSADVSEPNKNHSFESSIASPTGEHIHVPKTPVSEESMSQKGSPASSMPLGGHFAANSAPNSVGSPDKSEKVDDALKAQSNVLPSFCNESRAPPLAAVSEPLTGIVKPLVHQTVPAMTPLQGLSNLVPPDETGHDPPSSQPAYSTSLPSASTFAQTFSSSQPLFQPFLQPTLPVSTSSQNSPSSVGSSDNRGFSWAKSAPQTPPISTSASNVAHVAPQIQSSAADLTSQSSFLSTSATSFTTTPAIHGLQPHHQGSVPFPNMADTSPLTQHSHAAASTTSTSSNTTLAPSLSQGSDGPLSLSNLLPTQPFSQTDDLLSHPTPTLDYLNYSLTASSSAFRRPEFPSSLPSEIQSLLNPPPPSSTSHLPSSTISSTQSPPSPAISSPGTFTAQATPYSQYASTYRSHATTPTGFRAPASMPPGYPPYPAQYGPYAGQYPNLSPHPAATPQTPGMGQYGSLQTPANPYQGYPPPPPGGTGIPPYSSGLGSFGHGPYPPM